MIEKSKYASKYGRHICYKFKIYMYNYVHTISSRQIDNTSAFLLRSLLFLFRYKCTHVHSKIVKCYKNSDYTVGFIK